MGRSPRRPEDSERDEQARRLLSPACPFCAIASSHLSERNDQLGSAGRSAWQLAVVTTA